MTTPNTHAVRQIVEDLHDIAAHGWPGGGRVTCGAAADALDQLVAENERLRKDAERYRYLRDQSGFVVHSDPDRCDKEIDEYMAALATQAGTSGKDGK